MFEAADYKLADLLGIAGATIGIIIAGGVLLGCLSAKYIAISDRYRGLTSEYRQNKASDQRRGSILKQISTYRRQINMLNLSAMSVSLALILFVFTVGAASLSVIFPKALVFRAVGTGTLITGLCLIGLALVLVFIESYFERLLAHRELEDISDVPSLEDAMRV